ncbi:hypothetical protein [Deinococcus aquaticus]|uniref:hypothetical protein n=1 Tax=Deinococcus aquaticus TaxID=328692 RepID=UPI003F45AB10
MSFETVLQRLRDLAVRFDSSRPRVDPDRRADHDKRRQRIEGLILQLESYDPEFDEDPDAMLRQAGQVADRLEATLPQEGESVCLTFTVFPRKETVGILRAAWWDGQRWLLRGIEEDRAIGDSVLLGRHMGEEAFRTDDLDVWRGALCAHELTASDGVFVGLRPELDVRR